MPQTFVQQNPRQRDILAQLLAQGASTAPVQSLGEGFARLGQGALAGLTAGSLRRQDEDKDEKFKAMVQALVGGSSAKPWVDPDTGSVAPNQNPTGGYEGAMAALLGQKDNPQAAEMASSLLMKRIASPEAQGFTLGPGEQRFDANGNPIAGVDAKPQSDPALVAEYNFAKQNGFPGSYLDYVKAKGEASRAQTSIDARNMGTIPPGYRLVPGPDGSMSMEPIPGSPAATEQAGAQAAAAEKDARKKTSANIVVEDIRRARKLANESTIPTTGAGSFLSVIPGSAAADLSSTLDTIKANIGFDRLQQMRDSSPTGGALGAVNNQEMDLLQSVYGSLAQSQSKEQFNRNLDRLENVYLDIIHGPGNRPGAAPMNDNPPGWSIQKVE